LIYRAMHYAKHGIATAYRPSVRLSVTMVDHDHRSWKSWKLIARTIYHGAQGPHLPELTPLFFYSRIEWSGYLHSTLNSLPLHFF